jgi:SAM-dependent methyltransferase
MHMLQRDRSPNEPDPQDLASEELPPWLVAMAEFVLAETTPTPLPHVPEITLRLARESVPLWDKIERNRALRGGPPYWGFAWAAGLALARHVLDHPRLVAGRRVLDLASGSGLIGIAAAKSGAAHVIANDVDPLAVVAISLNADANSVTVEASGADLLPPDSGFDPASVDVVLVGDSPGAPSRSSSVAGWPAASCSSATRAAPICRSVASPRSATSRCRSRAIARMSRPPATHPPTMTCVPRPSGHSRDQSRMPMWRERGMRAGRRRDHPGSMPFFAITGSAAGALRKRTSSAAASRSLLAAPTPAVITT